MLRSQLLKGTSELLILSVLEEGERHGYEIAQQIRERGASLALGEGSLYPALHRLERRGALVAHWQPGERGPQRRYYRLTDAGRRLLEDSRAEWERYVHEVRKVTRAAVGEQSHE